MGTRIGSVAVHVLLQLYGWTNLLCYRFGDSLDESQDKDGGYCEECVQLGEFILTSTSIHLN